GRGGRSGSRAGPRSPGRARRGVPAVLVQRGGGHGDLPVPRTEQGSRGAGAPAGPRARGGRDHRGAGRGVAARRGSPRPGAPVRASPAVLRAGDARLLSSGDVIRAPAGGPPAPSPRPTSGHREPRAVALPDGG